MRSFVRTAVVALALLLPTVAAASELRLLPNGLPYGNLQLTFYEPGIDMRLSGARGPQAFGTLSIDDLFWETPWGSTFDYEATLETGPLVSLTIDDSNPDAVHSDYAFRGGVFTLTASWYDKFFVWQQGRYIAPVLALDIQITCEQELSTEDCGSSWGESKGYAFLSIGDGVFDHNLAHALRVQTRGSGPSFDTFILDGISGKPSDSSRDAGSALSQIKPELVATAPEPSILSLLLLVPAFWRRFRR
jgi:hypothetical protein